MTSRPVKSLTLTLLAVLCASVNLSDAITIDSELANVGGNKAGTECFVRVGLGERLPISETSRRVDTSALSKCEMECMMDAERCFSFSFGIGATGNGTCELSIREIPGSEERVQGAVMDPDYDVYAKRLNCDGADGPSQDPLAPIRPDFDSFFDENNEPPNGPSGPPSFRPGNPDQDTMNLHGLYGDRRPDDRYGGTYGNDRPTNGNRPGGDNRPNDNWDENRRPGMDGVMFGDAFIPSDQSRNKTQGYSPDNDNYAPNIANMEPVDVDMSFGDINSPSGDGRPNSSNGDPYDRDRRPSDITPYGGTIRPTGGTSRPTGGTYRPTGGSTRPTSGSSRPTGGSSRPTDGTSRPTSGSTRPTGSSRPYGGSGYSYDNNDRPNYDRDNTPYSGSRRPSGSSSRPTESGSSYGSSGRPSYDDGYKRPYDDDKDKVHGGNNRRPAYGDEDRHSRPYGGSSSSSYDRNERPFGGGGSYYNSNRRPYDDRYDRPYNKGSGYNSDRNRPDSDTGYRPQDDYYDRRPSDKYGGGNDWLYSGSGSYGNTNKPYGDDLYGYGSKPSNNKRPYDDRDDYYDSDSYGDGNKPYGWSSTRPHGSSDSGYNGGSYSHSSSSSSYGESNYFYGSYGGSGGSHSTQSGSYGSGSGSSYRPAGTGTNYSSRPHYGYQGNIYEGYAHDNEYEDKLQWNRPKDPYSQNYGGSKKPYPSKYGDEYPYKHPADNNDVAFSRPADGYRVSGDQYQRPNYGTGYGAGSGVYGGGYDEYKPTKYYDRPIGPERPLNLGPMSHNKPHGQANIYGEPISVSPGLPNYRPSDHGLRPDDYYDPHRFSIYDEPISNTYISKKKRRPIEGYRGNGYDNLPPTDRVSYDIPAGPNGYESGRPSKPQSDTASGGYGGQSSSRPNYDDYDYGYMAKRPSYYDINNDYNNIDRYGGSGHFKPSHNPDRPDPDIPVYYGNKNDPYGGNGSGYNSNSRPGYDDEKKYGAERPYPLDGYRPSRPSRPNQGYGSENKNTPSYGSFDKDPNRYGSNNNRPGYNTSSQSPLRPLYPSNTGLYGHNGINSDRDRPDPSYGGSLSSSKRPSYSNNDRVYENYGGAYGYGNTNGYGSSSSSFSYNSSGSYGTSSSSSQYDSNRRPDTSYNSGFNKPGYGSGDKNSNNYSGSSGYGGSGNRPGNQSDRPDPSYSNGSNKPSYNSIDQGSNTGSSSYKPSSQNDRPDPPYSNGSNKPSYNSDKGSSGYGGSSGGGKRPSGQSDRPDPAYNESNKYDQNGSAYNGRDKNRRPGGGEGRNPGYGTSAMGPAKKPGYGTITEIKTSLGACYRRVLAGKRVVDRVVLRVIPCERLEDCQRECAEERRFNCETFNYRLDPSNRGEGICELTSTPGSFLDIRKDFVDDRDYDFYELDRNSAPDCSLTWPNRLCQGKPCGHHGGSQYYHGSQSGRWDSHRGWSAYPGRGYGTDKRLHHDIRPHHEIRPHVLPGNDRVDWRGWDDRRDGGYNRKPYHDRRYDRDFVPYEIAGGVIDRRQWGQYGGSYGYGSGGYKDDRPYESHRPGTSSYDYWGLNSHDRGYLPNISKYPSRGVSHYDDRNDDHRGPGFNYFDLGHRDNKHTNWKIENGYAGGYGESYGYGSHGNKHWSSSQDFNSGGGYSHEFEKAPHGYRHEYEDSYEDSHEYGHSDEYGGGYLDDYHGYSRRPNECSSRSGSGFKIGHGIVRKALLALDVYECEKVCVSQTHFHCKSYSFRYAHGPSDNCFLSDRPYPTLDLYNDVQPDRDFDVYAVSDDRKYCQGSPSYHEEHGVGHHHGYVDDRTESDCFWRVRSGRRLSTAAARLAIVATGIGHCEAECLRLTAFTCRAFSFRHGPPAIGEIPENCQLTDWPRASLATGALSQARSCELYERGSYGRGCEADPFSLDSPNALRPISGVRGPKTSEECFLQYDTSAKLLPEAVRIGARLPTEEACKEHCAEFGKYGDSGVRGSPSVRDFRCMSFSYTSDPHLPPNKDNCLLSDIRLRDLEPGLDYTPSETHWLFAYNTFDPACHGGRFSSHHPHDHTGFDSDRFGPSSPGGYPSTGPSGPSGPPHAIGRPGPSGYPGSRPPPVGHGSGDFPRVDYDDLGLDTWSHFTVSGWPCRSGTKCARNRIAGHWSCELDGGEVGSWDYCCRPTHRCGHSSGFSHPWCYVGDKREQWRPCSDRYYPYASAGLTGGRPWSPGRPNGYNEDRNDISGHHGPPGPDSDRRYWNDLYKDGPQSFYDERRNPSPGYVRVPTIDKNRIRYHHNYRPASSSQPHWVPVRLPSGPGEDPSGSGFLDPPRPGGFGVGRYWPVAYLHKDSPPNSTYYKSDRESGKNTVSRNDDSKKPNQSERPIIDRRNDNTGRRDSSDERKPERNGGSKTQVLSIDSLVDSTRNGRDEENNKTNKPNQSDRIPDDDRLVLISTSNSNKGSIDPMDKSGRIIKNKFPDSSEDSKDRLDDKLERFTDGSVEIFTVDDNLKSSDKDAKANLERLLKEEKQIEEIGKAFARREDERRNAAVDKKSQHIEDLKIDPKDKFERIFVPISLENKPERIRAPGSSRQAKSLKGESEFNENDKRPSFTSVSFIMDDERFIKKVPEIEDDRKFESITSFRDARERFVPIGDFNRSITEKSEEIPTFKNNHSFKEDRSNIQEKLIVQRHQEKNSSQDKSDSDNSRPPFNKSSKSVFSEIPPSNIEFKHRPFELSLPEVSLIRNYGKSEEIDNTKKDADLSGKEVVSNGQVFYEATQDDNVSNRPLGHIERVELKDYGVSVHTGGAKSVESTTKTSKRGDIETSSKKDDDFFLRSTGYAFRPKSKSSTSVYANFKASHEIEDAKLRSPKVTQTESENGDLHSNEDTGRKLQQFGSRTGSIRRVELPTIQRNSTSNRIIRRGRRNFRISYDPSVVRKRLLEKQKALDSGEKNY